MSSIPENQIEDWLKKLERESWQLELLVSAFTIFLLIQATMAFDEFMLDLGFRYSVTTPMLGLIMIFLILAQFSLKALTICLIGHLMLRGFWIGTIGLRSVQSSIDFSKLNYNEFFTKKLKEKVISLDKMVIKLDEICSVIFAFAFLVISVLMAFGLYLAFMSFVIFIIRAITEILPDGFGIVMSIVSLILFTVIAITGIIYMIDYFTLGFFKKIKWMSRIYYPFYRLYNFITISVLTRSIYYYMISKFTKKRIRWLYGLVALLALFTFIFEYDQRQYFPDAQTDLMVSPEYYDDQMTEHQYVRKVSIPTRYVDKAYLPIFFRYNPADNPVMHIQCPEFNPIKDDGLNWRLSLTAEDGNLIVNAQDYSGEDFEQLIECHSSIYEVSINDSIYRDLKYLFYVHPAKNQEGLLATVPTTNLVQGENTLRVRKLGMITADSVSLSNYATIPFWYYRD